MLKISKDEKTLSRLKTPSLSDAKIKERADLQEFIWKSPKAFCEELGQDLWIIGKEVCPSDAVDDRIDLLAIDGSGRPTIIELKRGSHKLHLYQAISYAGMVAFAGADINEIRRQICAYRGVDSGRAAGIEDFLRGMEPEDLPGYEPRIILVAEAFEYEVLAGAKWLVERHGVDIACVQVSAANDETNGAEYLAFTQVFPTSEIEEIARSRKRRGSTSTHAPAPKVKPGAEKELLALADARQTRAMVEECRRLKDVWDEKPQADHFDYSRKTPEGWRDLLKVYIRPEPEKLDAPPGQLDLKVFTQNIADLTNRDHDEVRSALTDFKPKIYVKYCIIRLVSREQAHDLVAQLEILCKHENQVPATGAANGAETVPAPEN